jgi:hypothetical protein
VNTFHFAHVIGLHVGIVVLLLSGCGIAAATASAFVGGDPKATRNLWVAVGTFVLCTIVASGSCAARDICEVPHPNSREGDQT